MSDYTGNVRSGGASDARTLPELEISKLSVGPMDNNAYLLRCTRTGHLLLVDAANEADRLLAEVGDRPLGTVVTTHRHADHWQALADVVARTGAQTVAHTVDAPDLPVAVDSMVEHGSTVILGAAVLEVIHLRGHTPGSMALLYRDPTGSAHLFSGDSLFPGGVGKTQSPEDFATLLDDVTERVFDQLPDDTWVYPGHGPDTTLGAERPQLAEWRQRGW